MANKNEKVTMTWKGVEYNLVFTLNVMEEIQEEYGSISAWGELTDNEKEPNAKAVIFGLMCMINEGIDIDNEDKPKDQRLEPLTLKQVGRMLTEVGINNAAAGMKDLVVESTKGDDSKNA